MGLFGSQVNRRTGVPRHLNALGPGLASSNKINGQDD